MKEFFKRNLHKYYLSIISIALLSLIVTLSIQDPHFKFVVGVSTFNIGLLLTTTILFAKIKKQSKMISEKDETNKFIKKRLELAYDIGQIGVWEWEVGSDTISWDNNMKKMFEEENGKNLKYEDFINKVIKEDRDRVNTAIKDSVDNEAPYNVEYSIMLEDGQEKEILAIGEVIKQIKGKTLVGVCIEITRRKKLEIELQKALDELSKKLDQHKIYEELFSHSPTGIAIVGLDGSWLKVNDSLCDIVGYSKEELLQLKFQDITHKDDLDLDLDHVKNLLSGKETRYTFDKRYIRKDGTTVPIRLHVGLISDKNNKPKVFVSQVEDKTIDVKNELALKKSNKELEQFAYVVSHDLQEPIRMISSYVQLIEEQYNDLLDDKGKQFMFYAVDGANRMKKMINDILTYSRVNTQEVKFNNLITDQIIGDVLVDLKTKLNDAKAKINVKELHDIWADETRVYQIFFNLISNATKFKKENVPLKIEINSKIKDGFVEFSVKDNGIGIDPKYHETIFDFFKRLKAKDTSGSGIGLTICQKNVEAFGGKIWVESDGNSGSTFFFTIPQKRAKNETNINTFN